MTRFHVESWVWYCIVMVMVILRYASRVLHFKSVWRFQIEDYLMFFLACAYTVFTVTINMCVDTNSNLIDPKDIPGLTPEDIHERVLGSKYILVVEQMMCTIQWGTKACLLILYYRLTENLVQNIFVKAVGAYVAATFVVMEVLYLGYWCRPFHDYWQTPTNNVQCTTALHHLILNLSFNLSSDILILSIPLPLLIRAHLEIKRKILLCVPFSLGFFSITCAILSKHLSFTQPFSPDWVFWYTREASCVMIVTNMPYTWGLARRIFKFKSFWGHGSHGNDDDSLGRVETHDTGMEIVGGEMREIRGVDAFTEIEALGDDRKGSKSTWRRLSGMLGHGKDSEKATSTIMVQPKVDFQRTSPTSTQSNESHGEKQWTSVDWNQEESSADITRVTTSQSGVSPDSLVPPSPAILGSGIHRIQNTIPFRRPSTAERRRESILRNPKRYVRTSVAEPSRRASKSTAPTDAVDKLYRLEDEDLVADLTASKPHPECDGFD